MSSYQKEVSDADIRYQQYLEKLAAAKKSYAQDINNEPIPMDFEPISKEEYLRS